MKKFIITIVILLSIFFDIKAQYQSIFGQNSTEWVVELNNFDFGGQDTVYVEKDTTCFGHNWKKIMFKQFTDQFKGGLVREDTTIGKVWTKGLYFQHSSRDTIEMLAFDYSLNIGDTFNIANGYGGFDSLFRTVDSIYYINGSKYIQFDYFPYPIFPYLEKPTMIEGISGNMNLTWKFSGLSYLMVSYLLCTYKDGIKTTFENKHYNGNCVVNFNGIEEYSELTKSIQIYPNPTSDYLNIGYNNIYAILTKITLIDLQGKIIKEQNKNQTIDISDLPAGTYIIKLTFDNQFKTYKLFQKQ